MMVRSSGRPLLTVQGQALSSAVSSGSDTAGTNDVPLKAESISMRLVSESVLVTGSRRCQMSGEPGVENKSRNAEAFPCQLLCL